jgi:hypothetical protein
MIRFPASVKFNSWEVMQCHTCIMRLSVQMNVLIMLGLIEKMETLFIKMLAHMMYLQELEDAVVANARDTQMPFPSGGIISPVKGDPGEEIILNIKNFIGGNHEKR